MYVCHPTCVLYLAHIQVICMISGNTNGDIRMRNCRLVDSICHVMQLSFCQFSTAQTSLMCSLQVVALKEEHKSVSPSMCLFSTTLTTSRSLWEVSLLHYVCVAVIQECLI